MTRPKLNPLPVEGPKSEQWFAVVDRASGEAVSFGTVVADPLPAHLEAVPIASQPSKRAGTRWDAASKSVATIPVVEVPSRDVVGELLADPVVSAITEKLSKAESAALAEKLRAKFG
ncbi:MAG: hypothetical protein EKK55_14305 [Rhodocyclaceae bacterium]|nr:MAG: hypothetical protein EKK55_14305 [Rhodocyclaceae bacterium]